jgi:hypothetical protein
MVKIKGYRFECEVCQVKTSIQVFFRADGQVGYARARHMGADKRFYYHQQNLEYVNRKLGEIVDIGHGQIMGKFIEQSRLDSGIKLSSVVGPPGFEPESIEPKSTSLDQASRRPHTLLVEQYFPCTHKNLVKTQTKTVARNSG